MLMIVCCCGHDPTTLQPQVLNANHNLNKTQKERKVLHSGSEINFLAYSPDRFLIANLLNIKYKTNNDRML